MRKRQRKKNAKKLNTKSVGWSIYRGYWVDESYPIVCSYKEYKQLVEYLGRDRTITIENLSTSRTIIESIT